MTKILVIEDEVIILEEVIEWLQFEGYEAVGAPNGRLGLETAARFVPDLIVCDIAMPEVDGYEVLIEVRSQPALSHIPVIFATAATGRETIRKGLDLGANDYLTKPFTHAELLGAIRATLEKAAAQEHRLQSHLSTLTAALDAEREKRLLKTRLMAMFSHDFRNPLSLILSSVSILKSYDDRLTPDRKQRHLSTVEGAVHLLTQMLDDMLVLAEIETGHMEISNQDLDISALVETIVEEFQLIDQDLHRIRLHNQCQRRFISDPRLIRQILANLLSNAIKYSDVETEIVVKMTEDDAKLCLEVHDQGIGIPVESMSSLFEPFYRASNIQQIKGTGLGLAIVKQCVDRLGGQIHVESQINQGTQFSVTLPRIRAVQS